MSSVRHKFDAGNVRLRRTARDDSTRRAVTLVEMLIVIAVTMVLMFALTQIFSMLGTGIQKGRSIMEMNGQVRALTVQLQNDLDGITVNMFPWLQLQSGLGYAEFTEGPGHDYDTDGDGANNHNDPDHESFHGDIDDVLMFTSRKKDGLFVGRFGNTNVQSNMAEIIWWVQLDGDGIPNVYRRVLLVRPDLNLSGANVATFFQDNDISAHREGTSMVANTLADLTKRENRFAHDPNPNNFPNRLNMTLIDANNLGRLTGNRQGEDIMLGQVAAFDLRVFDSTAFVKGNGNTAMIPSDPGYTSAPNFEGSGAYVDMNYTSYVGAVPFPTTFSHPPQARSRLTLGTYDTWPFHYEHDGLNQDGNAVVDQGTNGLDDDTINGVDDPGERETSPPYPVPLRGLQVKIRVLERDSGTVRQATVTANFVPE